MQTPFTAITVEHLARLLADPPDDLQLVDVREPEEIAIVAIPGFQAFPLSDFGTWAPDIEQRLNPAAETIVLCHHGVRSAQMCQWLSQRGFSNVKNVIGGIDAYAVIVDSSLPRY